MTDQINISGLLSIIFGLLVISIVTILSIVIFDSFVDIIDSNSLVTNNAINSIENAIGIGYPILITIVVVLGTITAFFLSFNFGGKGERSEE
jgi:hypothetical protein